MKKSVLSLLVLGCITFQQQVLANDGEALSKSKSCMACHSVDMKMVGPALRDVATKYAGQKDADITLAAHIKNGSQGVWGAMPMAANPVSEEEAKTLANWVLSLKK